MADILYFNGRFTTTDEPVVHVEDRGLQFGDSLYEVIKFVESKPRFGQAHWQRMAKGLSFLEIDSPWPDWPSFGRVLQDVLDRTEFAEGILYIQITRGVSPRSHFSSVEMTPTTIVYSRRLAFPDDAAKRTGVGVVRHPDTRWKYCNVKSTNLLPNTMAKREAVRAGASETLLIEDGQLTEGALSNMFMVRGGTVITHPKNHQILPGIVRDKVIGLAGELGIAVEERPIENSEIASCDEMFLTSTTQGVMPITSVDGSPLASGTIGEVTTRLQRAFDELEHSERAVDAI